MEQLKIDAEFQALIPPLSPDELRLLEQSLISEGCRDPLVKWGDVVLDGHNRYEICTRHGIPFQTVNRDFPTRKAARVWIRNNQLGRRNLTDGWRIELALGNKADLIEIGLAKKSEAGGDKKSEEAKIAFIKNDKSDPDGDEAEYEDVDGDIDRHNTQAEIAEVAGVSTGKVAQAEIVRRQAPEVWERVKAGEETVGGAYKQIREAAKPHVANNSGENEWYTPAEYIEIASAVMGGVDLDPASCTEANTVVGAKQFFSVNDDGLTKEWRGTVWMNPPYSQPAISHFCDKLVSEVTSQNVTHAMVLVNNATETKWFQSLLGVASAVCFPLARVKFWHPTRQSAPLQGQALIYVGSNMAAFIEKSKGLGATCYVKR